MAYLYRKYDNYVVPADTQLFYQFGYYWFAQVREGDYIVKVALTDQSMNYFDYTPAYHEHSLFWTNSNTVSLFGSDNYTVNVNLYPFEDLLTGPGNISGFVAYQGSENQVLNNLSGIEVFLLNEEYSPLSIEYTDDNGQFNFTDLPLGTYLLYAEETGYFTEAVTIELSEGNNAVTGIHLVIYEEALGVKQQEYHKISIGPAYPNPVDDLLWLDLKSPENNIIIIEVYSLMGQKMLEKSLTLTADQALTTNINTENIVSGTYLLTVSIPGKSLLSIQKFIK